MKISNFRDYSKSHAGDVHYATVDLISGILWWKKATTIRVFRHGRNHWRAVDSQWDISPLALRQMEMAHFDAPYIQKIKEIDPSQGVYWSFK